MRDGVHTDKEKVSTKASYYIDKHLKKKDQVLLCSNMSVKAFLTYVFIVSTDNFFLTCHSKMI